MNEAYSTSELFPSPEEKKIQIIDFEIVLNNLRKIILTIYPGWISCEALYLHIYSSLMSVFWLHIKIALVLSWTDCINLI